MTDSQQARTIEPSSPCQTPNLDRIAENGTRFSRCYASNQLCSPSRASMATGHLPHNHGMVTNSHSVEPYRARFRDDLDTWSQRLSEAGYHLAHFGKWHVERSGDLAAFGYDDYEINRSEAFDRNFAEYRREHGLDVTNPHRDPSKLSNTRTVSQPGYDDLILYGTHDEPNGTYSHYLYSRGIDFLRESADRHDPWCLTISTGAPHDPFTPPAEIYDRYDPDEIPKPTNFHDSLADKPDVYQRIPAVWEAFSWEDFATTIAHYYAYCTYIDELIGDVLETLEAIGQRDETVVIFCSDHGDMMAGHRMFTHGFGAFEEVYHSPLLIDWPDLDSGPDECDEIVQLHDLAPTLVDIGTDGAEAFPEPTVESRNPHQLGSSTPAPSEPSFRAMSLVPFLRGSRPSGFRNEGYAEFEGDSFSVTQRIYWRDDMKYVFNGFARDELYDLAADPGETMNLIDHPAYEEVKRSMAARFWEIAHSTGDYTLSHNHYWVNRFAPIGPNGIESEDS